MSSSTAAPLLDVIRSEGCRAVTGAHCSARVRSLHGTPASRAGKPWEEVPLIDWEEASTAVAGDEPDDAFLVELMATFYHECATHVRAILNGVIAYRDGGARAYLDPEAVAHGREAGVELTEAKPVVRIIKDEAHAIKGSAANLRFWRLARVRRGCVCLSPPPLPPPPSLVML